MNSIDYKVNTHPRSRVYYSLDQEIWKKLQYQIDNELLIQLSIKLDFSANHVIVTQLQEPLYYHIIGE